MSNTNARAPAICSNAIPPLTMMPTPAARLMALMTATGTARMSGQGVATTSMDRIVRASPVIPQPIPHMTRVSGVNHTA